MATALQDQDAILKELLKIGKSTDFGKEHRLEEANSYEDFKKLVPIRDYESYKPYIEKIERYNKNTLAIKLKGYETYLKTSQSQTAAFREWVEK